MRIVLELGVKDEQQTGTLLDSMVSVLHVLPEGSIDVASIKFDDEEVCTTDVMVVLDKTVKQ